MTREESWQVQGITLQILQQIESLGLIVSVHRLGGSLLGSAPASVEMHAVRPDAETPKQYIARVPLNEHDEPDYACAVLLEERVEVDLLG